MADETSRLIDSGLLDKFIREKNYAWTHSDWLVLLDRVRSVGVREMDEKEIGALLEAEKKRLLYATGHSQNPPPENPPPENPRRGVENRARRWSDDSLRCSFCHKSQDVVGKLISSPSDYPRTYICDECVLMCVDILRDDGEPIGRAEEIDLSGFRNKTALQNGQIRGKA